MYVRQLTVSNIRSVEKFEFALSADESPGWHVILGPNGAGKSTAIRSLALALVGPKEAAALRQNFAVWQRQNAPEGHIALTVEAAKADIFSGAGRRASSVQVDMSFQPVDSTIGGRRYELAATSTRGLANRTIWGTNAGWFSSSFGPFRRFTGGDQAFERLFYSNPRLAPHLSAFGEDVALTEGLRWLRELRIKELEGSAEDGLLLARLIDLLNHSGLLPHGATIEEVTSDSVAMRDAAGIAVSVEQMSDGYRSLLSMIFEILRQMTKAYGTSQVTNCTDIIHSCVHLPGVVAIDEVDAHLHPTWQKEIGPWFKRCFPELQFIVTTHSPIICRSATSVWKLPDPGSEDSAERVEGTALNRLINGSILDAYGTEFFGKGIERSDSSKDLLAELAALNRKALRVDLSADEKSRMNELRHALPTQAADLADS
jgi:predicted ATPase